MLNLQNLEIVEFKELNFIKYYKGNINYGTFKLVGENLQELLAVVQYNA